MLSNSSANGCKWTFVNEANTKGGFAMYNSEHKCHLASTFRALPDFTASYTNDTIITTLHLKLETSCTKSASVASSRLFVIDQLTERHSQRKEASRDSTTGILMRAIDYFEARKRLAAFRRRTTTYQEHLQGTTDWSWNQAGGLMCMLYLTLWIMDTLARQRHVLPARKAASPYGLRVAFVLAHLCMSAHRSPRVVGLISLFGVMDVLGELRNLIPHTSGPAQRVRSQKVLKYV